jgi:hypothetical protein
MQGEAGMRKLIHKKFFKTNTNYGVMRYLSGLGFHSYEFIPGPTRDYVYAVSVEDLPVEPADISSLRLEVANILIKAGYETVRSIKEASDEDLLAIPGISDRRLRLIRELGQTN